MSSIEGSRFKTSLFSRLLATFKCRAFVPEHRHLIVSLLPSIAVMPLRKSVRLHGRAPMRYKRGKCGGDCCWQASSLFSLDREVRTIRSFDEWRNTRLMSPHEVSLPSDDVKDCTAELDIDEAMIGASLLNSTTSPRPQISVLSRANGNQAMHLAVGCQASSTL